jgi:hypothetical protein
MWFILFYKALGIYLYFIDINCLSHSLNNKKCSFVQAFYYLKQLPTDWANGVRFPAGTGSFSLCHLIQTGSGARPASCPIGTGASFSGSKVSVVNLTTQLILVPRLRMLRVIHPLPQYVFMEW